MSDQLREAYRRFDTLNSGDPVRGLDADGLPQPKALLYGWRMTKCLKAFAPDASEAVRLAVHAQHLARYRLPRGDYPEGRAGYKLWRQNAARKHAEWAAEILADIGYTEDTTTVVTRLIRKKQIKVDPEAQLLEDVACLVFLEHYLGGFRADYEEAKVVNILQKTWVKMSERAREVALTLSLDEDSQELLHRALEADNA